MHADAPPASSALPVPVETHLPTTLPTAEQVRQLQLHPAHVVLLERLLEYAQTNGLTSYSAIAKELNLSTTTISRIYRGDYKASPQNVVRTIEQFLRMAERRAELGAQPVVETSVTRQVATICDLARESATMGWIFGKNQTGKTTALERYADEHVQAVYVRMPAGGATRLFAEKVAKAIGRTERRCFGELRDTIFGHFRPGMLLIVDEYHQAIISRQPRVSTVELIREIHDICKCGVVLCGTDAMPGRFADERLRDFLGQTANRGVLRLQVPVVPPAADITAVREAYGFPGMERGSEEFKAVKEMVKAHGLGFLCKNLRMAVGLANKRGEQVSWEHFLVTLATNKAAAEGKLGEGGDQ